MIFQIYRNQPLALQLVPRTKGDKGRMTTEVTVQPVVNEDERVTTEATEEHPAIVEPAKPVRGPQIHLYTSLSSGSSYVKCLGFVLTIRLLVHNRELRHC
jgi:hypothetical protein